MDYTKLRKLSLKCFIAFLAITGLYAVVIVLVGKFGEFEAKVMATTFTISAANICALACATVIEKRGFKAPGQTGMGFTTVAGLLTLAGIWFEFRFDPYWKFTSTVIVCAAGFAHAFLLLLPKLGERQRWFQPTAVAMVSVLAAMIILAIWAEIDVEEYFRLLAAVAIVVVLQTLVTPLLARLARRPVVKQTLVLEPVEDGVYQDSGGRRYRLMELAEE